jgi:Ser/Thr protein kinase RdoA (MazF antagonist)
METMGGPFGQVPAERRDALRAALGAAFGTARVEALAPVGGGASGALIYRADVAGRPYLLRLETRRDAMRNPHQYACMRIAADAGIAPPLHHVDEAAGVSVMEFLPQRPWEEYPGGAARLARDVGALAARMQATAPFPELAPYDVILDSMLRSLTRGRVFAEGLLDPHLAGFARVRAAYPWGRSPLVSSHNDPNVRNVLFDGEHLWLVDWETAYRNEAMTDVAILVENFGGTPGLEADLLAGWLGRAPDRAQRAQLVLMRQLTRLYYAGLVLSAFVFAPRGAPDADLSAPTPAEFRADAEAGRLTIGPELMYTLGKMYLAWFLAELGTPAFEEALGTAAG